VFKAERSPALPIHGVAVQGICPSSSSAAAQIRWSFLSKFADDVEDPAGCGHGAAVFR
jgi:hypothetical protein